MSPKARHVVFSTVLLAIVALAWYFASLQQGRSPWGGVIAVALIALALFGNASRIVARLMRLSPEHAAALAHAMQERGRCKRCGTLGRPDDIFCNTCHPSLPLVIAVLAAGGLGWAAWLLVSTR
jgi:hypothetical protein